MSALTLPYRAARSAKWKAERAAALEEDIVLPRVQDVAFCQCCARDFDGPVYSAMRDGMQWWMFLCGRCAADWLAQGGNLVLRWYS